MLDFWNTMRYINTCAKEQHTKTTQYFRHAIVA